ncbi:MULTISPECIES: biotin carboxylase N-terminal domain-containing protein [unclassified Pseudonocardia]|uniref:acetyl-CoA carboxylase biotin carboxylase subunit n=1 Tax=unclassified Pseudonocardia TaxID=2619320 RepID=UPI0001FFEE9E|nr:biotin carboxylase N-terminal domain-containing protein [Pseudonocardia sp. Ae707_Ps1]OLM09244.1 Biotin carboxylase of acetyl-CoA carboxylase [Pseudonocardia sp. Ae707_Ps1]
MPEQLRRVLVANRGEIALRILRACFDEGIETVLAVSEADRESQAAQLADRTILIGPAAAGQSYLAIDRIVQAALSTGCDALHPGYGFLSERPELADACADNGVVFVGPSGEIMRRAGDKMTAREVAEKAGIPIGGRSRPLQSRAEAEEALSEALDNGASLPMMLKASAGGGGRGMSIIRDAAEIGPRFDTAHREAEQAFGDGRLYLERYVAKARHVEVQVLADAYGTVCHLGDRDCSTQRRHQKLVEEGPAPDLPAALSAEIRGAAVRLASELGYVGAGTVEFLVDVDRGDFVFLEVNARVQVEHPVSEMVSGIDIVREQLRVAAGRPLSFSQDDVVLDGHAVEIRINAEDPERNFLPTPGTITRWAIPAGTGVRVDTFAYPGAVVSPYYDSLVAKVITHAPTRAEAVAKMVRVLRGSRIEGIATTVPLQLAVLESPEFQHSPVTTRWLEEQYLPAREKGASSA